MNRRIAIVIGAGASKAFDPAMGTGQDLVREISQRVTDKNAKADGKEPYLSERLEKFHKLGQLVRQRFEARLTEHMKSCVPSIDAFIDRVQRESIFDRDRHEFDLIAKLLVVYHILGYEGECLTNASFNRYSWLNEISEFIVRSKLNSYAHRLVDLKIITFNYDRLIEEFLYRNHGHTIREFAEKSIIHVYGKVAPLAWQDDKKGVADFLMFGHPNDDDERVLQAKDRISYIYSDRKNNPSIKPAFEAIEDSDIVIFLGYGFDDVNNELLGIREPLKAKLKIHSYSSSDFQRVKGLRLVSDDAIMCPSSCEAFIQKVLSTL